MRRAIGTKSRRVPTTSAEVSRIARSLPQRVRRLFPPDADTLPQAQPPLPRELTAEGSRVSQLPLPAGWSRAEVFELLSSVSIDGAPPQELHAYVSLDFERFVLTYDLVRDRCGPALEIGANPYFTTVLLREFTDIELTLTNSFSGEELAVESQRVTYHGPPGRSIDIDTELEYRSLNIEATPFPYEDASFGTVIFCEVIEHLTNDPVRALREINRVLADDGVLVLSTPNVARLENVARVAAGANIYDPYSGYGAYGRHNREFTRHELVRLLEFCGFHVEHHFTADVHAHATAHFVDVAKLLPLVEHRTEDLGQYLFCRAVKKGVPREGRPREFYRSWPPDQLVDLG